MKNIRRSKTKPYGVRLDAVEKHILETLMDKRGRYASEIFREALIMLARAEDVETDRSTIMDTLRRQSADNE